MTIDLEGDLRREFDAATPPSSLTFHPESIMRQGNRTIRRHRIVAGGSTAMALALVVTGASLLSPSKDLAAPQPAARTATTGIVGAQTGFMSGEAKLEFNRDASVRPNVKYSFTTPDGHRHEMGSSSTNPPGQRADAIWTSAVVEGHPVTIGLVPGINASIKFAGDASHGIAYEELKGTGYRMFVVDYTQVYPEQKKATRPAEIASISWSGPDGIVDGIAGDDRLTGRVLTIDKNQSVTVTLRPGMNGQTTVLGQSSTDDVGFDLTSATTDLSGVGVATGRTSIIRRSIIKGVSTRTATDGPPMVAGILAAGASEIGVVMTTGEVASGLPVSERLPDGRVIFAVKVESDNPPQASKDSIKAVTWTNADGSQGRKDVTQQPR